MTASLLPANATRLERAIEQAIVSDVPVNLRALWRPDDCPIELLPWLAWALSIDGWSSDWPDAVKRARVAQAIPIQRVKGTVRSVREVVRAFGGGVAIREWWQMTPPGPPHTFDLLLTLNGGAGEPASAAFVDQVVAEVARTKPLRSHFTFTQGVNAAGAIGAIAVTRAVVFARLQLDA